MDKRIVLPDPHRRCEQRGMAAGPGSMPASVTKRVGAAAAFLATFPPDDIAALLRDAQGRQPLDADASVWRSDAAAAVLATLEPRVAWRLLAVACERRIIDLRSGQEGRAEGESPTPWIQILWDNAVEFAARAGDLDSRAINVAHDLVAGQGWTGPLDDLLTTVRGILVQVWPSA